MISRSPESWFRNPFARSTDVRYQRDHSSEFEPQRMASAARDWVRDHTVAYITLGIVLGATLGCLIKRK